MSNRPITISLSPNTEADDVRGALLMLLTPWRWQHGNATSRVERWFDGYLQMSGSVSFNSGRSGLFALLKAFDIGPGDEVIVQAFTCVAVPNSVLWAGASPVYGDIDETYNLDPTDLEKKITKKTRAIVVQHTFGIPAAMAAILACAKKHKLLVIEDCAHSLGGTYKGKKLGTLGDAAFFSFGRDKIVSSVFGGVAVISYKFKVQSSKLRAFEKRLTSPSSFWILQQLLHPVAFAGILATYNIYVGKILLVLLQRLGLLSFPVDPMEKHGGKPVQYPAKYPNALAYLLLNQLQKLERYNDLRQQSARFYQKKFALVPALEGAVYLRFPIWTSDPAALLARAKAAGILLGNWYHNVIDPSGVDLATVGYARGSCPKAEATAAHCVNLPTRISSTDLERVVALL